MTTAAKLSRARGALTAMVKPQRHLTCKQRITFMLALARCGLAMSK